jgi:apolipoprotein N-acyltransferase
VTTGFLLLSTLAYGLFTLATSSAGTSVKVALVQGNIPQERKWDRSFRQETVARYARLTRQAVEQAPTLIVWPETAVPGDVEHDPDLRRALARIAIDARSHLLIGSAEYAKFTDRKLRERLYNSMYLVSPEGTIAGQYRKIRLVPFGEYTPLRDLITWPETIAATSGAFAAGDRYTRFTVGDVSFSAVVCWEIIYPDLFREFVKGGAQFMILGTNEAWFGDTAAPYQLLAMTVFRAVENRVAIARSANTGVTALIDPFGRITHRLRGPDGRDLFVEGVLAGNIAVAAGKTLYTAYGDVFAYLAIGATLFLASWAMTSSAMRGPVAHGVLAAQGS